MTAWIEGVKDIIEPCIILLLAWALGTVIENLHTGEFLVSFLGKDFPTQFIPLLVYVLAMLISFATGTAFGTMGIMFPLVMPLAHQSGDKEILLQSIGAILGGVVFGNHASPIADDSILAALAAGR